MDDRVYTVEVCASCLTQVSHDADGNFDVCLNCNSFESKPIRFRVARGQVLEQADPHQSLVERTVYYGCVGQAGHYYHDRNLRKLGRRSDSADVTPWGLKVDGGLIPRGTPLREGEAHVVHQHGWTALAFEDRSVDHRGGSWSVYCIPATLDGTEALVVARAAYPSIFARYQFDVELAGANPTERSTDG